MTNKLLKSAPLALVGIAAGSAAFAEDQRSIGTPFVG